MKKIVIKHKLADSINLGIAICALVSTSTYSAMASANTALLTDDSYAAIKTPSKIFGKAGDILVSPAQTGYLNFDLNMPENYTGANIARATVKLFVGSMKTGGNLAINQITGNWSEGALSGVNLPAVSPSTTTIPIGMDRKLRWIEIDVTTLVQAWIDANPNNQNFGLALKSDAGLNVKINSKENGKSSHEPALDIVWDNPGSAGLPGPQGPQGQQGPQGLQGPKGDKGDIGVAGLKGDTGATGSAGPQGAVGPTGPAGAKGDTGATGPKGDTGTTGPKGDTGLTGAAGAQGPSGVVATVNLNGSIGGILANETAFTFHGPTADITITDTQRITVTLSAALKTKDALSFANFYANICYQLQPSGAITEFVTPGFQQLTATSTRIPFSLAQSVMPRVTGTYRVGLCTQNRSPSTNIDDNDFLQGWVMVTN